MRSVSWRFIGATVSEIVVTDPMRSAVRLVSALLVSISVLMTPRRPLPRPLSIPGVLALLRFVMAIPIVLMLLMSESALMAVRLDVFSVLLISDVFWFVAFYTCIYFHFTFLCVLCEV
jgi:hypothetical protein